MDRKNKKAAQLNNQSNGNHSNHQNSSDGHNKNNRRGRGGVSNLNANGRERDRNGEAKPDKVPSKPAGNLTATAPPISGPSEQPAGDGPQLVSPQSDSTPTTATAPQDLLSQVVAGDAAPSPTAAQARPTVPKRFSSGKNGSSDLGYGPIGSPPNVNPLTSGGLGMRPSYPASNNHGHFSPGTSPPSGHIQPSTSPFTHGEGKQQFFGAYIRGGPGGRPEQSPIAIQRGGPWGPPLLAERNENAVDSDEDDYEDFVPSSLNDLLTPEERKRRLSRSGGSRNVVGLGVEGSVGNVGLGPVGSMGSVGMGNHRYSRSVPAARLLEAANAWKEVDRDRDNANISVASLSYRSTGMSDGFSPSHLQLATSNASGAFLHGRHYARNGSITANATVSQLTRQIASQSFEETDVLGAVPTLSTRGGRYESPYSIQAVNRVSQLGSDALSPTSRALQSHAPGQSLPQGLAAGISRLHFASPGVSGPQNGHKVAGVSMGMGMQHNEGGGMIGNTSVRSPLRSQFLNAVGTPPDSRLSSFGGLPTSSSPGGFSAVRPWLQQHQGSSGGMMAPPPTKVGTGVGAGLGSGGVGAIQKPAHDTEDDLFAFDDLEG
jgi:hypothetical protein